jgi:transcriptional regulator with XRE-family HTH domain
MTMTFGEELRKLIKSRGIKATTLAQRMNVTCPYISQLITGIRKPGRETLLKLSKSLEVPLETLLVIETDIVNKRFASRRIPVLDEAQIMAWGNFMDLDYPILVANRFEYVTTDDPNAFYIACKGFLQCYGVDSCDLILIEPNKQVASGDTIFVSSPGGLSIKKILIKEDIVILTEDKKEPVVLTKENIREGWIFYRVSQCIKKF